MWRERQESQKKRITLTVAVFSEKWSQWDRSRKKQNQKAETNIYLWSRGPVSQLHVLAAFLTVVPIQQFMDKDCV